MKQCPTCGKGTIMAAKRNLLRGKYNPTKKTRRYPNLQWATFPSGKRLKICASCIKRGIHLQPSYPKKLVKKFGIHLEQFFSKGKKKSIGRHE